jgi:hypothetical protein
MRFEVLTAVTTNITVFWDVTSCTVAVNLRVSDVLTASVFWELVLPVLLHIYSR